MRIISGFLKNRRLMLPPACYTRPTMDRTREAVFSILSSQRDFSFSGSLILDVFAGSGAYGLESLSRGAKHAFFIENQPEVRAVLEKNILNLGVRSTTTLMGFHALKAPKTITPMDLVFMDPPYGQDLVPPTLHHLKDTGWIGLKTLILVETEKDHNPFESLTQQWHVRVNRAYGKNNIFLGVQNLITRQD